MLRQVCHLCAGYPRQICVALVWEALVKPRARRPDHVWGLQVPYWRGTAAHEDLTCLQVLENEALSG